MKKKIISMLLCLMLVLSVLPMHADADTSTVKGILAANGITYDDTQYSLACVYAESAVADMLKDQSYYRPEMEDFVNSISIPVSVWIDGKMLAEKIDNKWVSQKYYLISSDGTSCEEKEFSRDINSSRTMAYSEGNGNIIAFLIPKSSEYFLIPYYGAEPYTYMNDPSIPDEYSVFNGSSTHQGTCMGYRGVADSGDMEFEFEMEWNAGCSCIKIEPFVYNPASNIVDMTSFTEEGELNVTYYVELRDPATGEIFPLPKQWYHNIGYSSYDPDATLQANILMREDGLMDMTSDEWTFIDGHYYGCTGEIDLYIPYGYEFRISVYDSNIYQDGQALYGDSLQYSWRGEYAGDGFYRVTKPHFGSNQGWVQVLFAPLTEEIRVEKQVVGSDNGAEYIMHAERTVYELGEDFSTYVPAKQNYQLPLRNYLYRLFDADTDTEIEPAAEHRTDSEGNFSLKGGQYALFRTYTLPENLPSVPTDGANMMFIDNYDQWTDIEKIRDVYSFEEVSTGNFVTSVDLVRNGETTTIDGSKIDKAYGEDEIYFKNVLGDPIVGNLTITKNFLGLEEDEIPVDDIYFTFTADGEKTDEVLYLKDFDCEDGVYSITVPFIVGTYAIEEHGAEIDGYKFTCRIPDSFELNSEGYTLLLDNIYEKKTGSLTVTKTVAGTAADSTEAFSFTVILGDTSVNGVFGDMNFVNGAANFTLKDGESKTASGLPAGTDFTVTEADYSADGYVTTASGDTGTIADGETASAVFTNTKDADEPAPTPPPTPDPEPTPTPTPDPEPAPGPEDPVVPQTGDSIHPVFWAMLLAAGAAGIAGLIVYGKKIKRN